MLRKWCWYRLYKGRHDKSLDDKCQDRKSPTALFKRSFDKDSALAVKSICASIMFSSYFILKLFSNSVVPIGRFILGLFYHSVFFLAGGLIFRTCQVTFFRGFTFLFNWIFPIFRLSRKTKMIFARGCGGFSEEFFFALLFKQFNLEKNVQSIESNRV